MLSSKQIPSILLNVIFISVFIGIFFFTYGSQIEQNIVKTQSYILADNITSELSVFMTPTQAQFVASTLRNPDLSTEDAHVAEKNGQLKTKAMKVLGIGSLIGIGIVWMLCSHFELDFIQLIKHNLIVLLFVALTEYIFLTYIAQNFIITDMNFVKHKIYTLCKERFITFNK